MHIGGGGAKSTPGARQTARPIITDQNTKNNLIWMKFYESKPPSHTDHSSEIKNDRKNAKMLILVVLLIYSN